MINSCSIFGDLYLRAYKNIVIFIYCIQEYVFWGNCWFGGIIIIKSKHRPIYSVLPLDYFKIDDFKNELICIWFSFPSLLILSFLHFCMKRLLQSVNNCHETLEEKYCSGNFVPSIGQVTRRKTTGVQGQHQKATDIGKKKLGFRSLLTPKGEDEYAF